MDLSGTRISYDSPLNYSNRYPKQPADTQTHYRINIHDQDLYEKENRKVAYIQGIRQVFWDYGRSWIWRSAVKSTLSMTVALYRTAYAFDPKDYDAFIKTLQAEFKLTYKKNPEKPLRLQRLKPIRSKPSPARPGYTMSSPSTVVDEWRMPIRCRTSIISRFNLTS